MVWNKRLLGVPLLACALAAGCDDDNTPTAPTNPVLVTATFTGSVSSSGAATHTFSTSTSGSVKATLKSIGTDNTLVVSFALGNVFGETCSLVLANDAATGGSVLGPGTMTGAGTLCARISDVGHIPAGQRADYTIEVEHPQ
jgi:hypothetical protein